MDKRKTDKATEVAANFKLFEWVVKFKEKYGILNILTSGMLMVFMSLMIAISFNPSIVFDRYKVYEERRHTESFNYRMKTMKMMNLMMERILEDMKGQRCFIIELHNGKTNSTGLSFNYGSLTYEHTADSVSSIMEEYIDFTIDRYQLLSYVYENGHWEGSTEEMRIIDHRLSMRLESNDSYYICITTIFGVKSEIGFLGITYNKEPNIPISTLQNKMMRFAAELSPLLDGERINDKDQ